MSALPGITFFMPVTDSCAMIADYAIRSYRLLRREKIDYRLCVYANTLSSRVARKYFPKWAKWPYVEIRDNREHVTVDYPKVGAKVTSPEGVERVLNGKWEWSDTVWTRELSKFDTPFVATVDADFEILEPGFVRYALELLRADPRLAGVSTDYEADNSRFYNPYDGRMLYLHQRWHAWFCIYRNACLKIGVSHYYYESQDADHIIHAYDAGGYLQHALLERGWRFQALGKEWQRQFIHYSAFAQNNRIHARDIAAYRRYRLLMKRGLIPSMGFSGSRGRLNRWVGYGAHELFVRRFGGADRGRMKFNYVEDSGSSADRLYE